MEANTNQASVHCSIEYTFLEALFEVTDAMDPVKAMATSGVCTDVVEGNSSKNSTYWSAIIRDLILSGTVRPSGEWGRSGF